MLATDVASSLTNVGVPLDLVACSLLTIVLLLVKVSNQFRSYPSNLFIAIVVFDLLTSVWKSAQWSSGSLGISELGLPSSMYSTGCLTSAVVDTFLQLSLLLINTCMTLSIYAMVCAQVRLSSKNSIYNRILFYLFASCMALSLTVSLSVYAGSVDNSVGWCIATGGVLLIKQIIWYGLFAIQLLAIAPIVVTVYQVHAETHRKTQIVAPVGSVNSAHGAGGVSTGNSTGTTTTAPSNSVSTVVAKSRSSAAVGNILIRFGIIISSQVFGLLPILLIEFLVLTRQNVSTSLVWFAIIGAPFSRIMHASVLLYKLVPIGWRMLITTDRGSQLTNTSRNTSKGSDTSRHDSKRDSHRIRAFQQEERGGGGNNSSHGESSVNSKRNNKETAKEAIASPASTSVTLVAMNPALTNSPGYSASPRASIMRRMRPNIPIHVSLNSIGGSNAVAPPIIPVQEVEEADAPSEPLIEENTVPTDQRGQSPVPINESAAAIVTSEGTAQDNLDEPSSSPLSMRAASPTELTLPNQIELPSDSSAPPPNNRSSSSASDIVDEAVASGKLVVDPHLPSTTMSTGTISPIVTETNPTIPTFPDLTAKIAQRNAAKGIHPTSSKSSMKPPGSPSLISRSNASSPVPGTSAVTVHITGGPNGSGSGNSGSAGYRSNKSFRDATSTSSSTLSILVSVAYVVPVVMFFSLSIAWLVTLLSGVNEAADVKQHVAVSVNIGNLIHECQTERGTTNVYLTSPTNTTFAAVVKQRLSTDARLEVVEDGVTERIARMFAKSCTTKQEVDAILAQLSTFRQSMDIDQPLSTRPSRSTSFAFYTNLNLKNLDVVNCLLSTIAPDASLVRLLEAYLSFMKAKEYMGQFRATSTPVLQTQSYSNGTYLSLVNQVAVRNTLLDRYKQITSDSNLALYNQLTDPSVSSFMPYLQSGETLLLGGDPTAIAAANLNPTAWFANVTNVINAFKKVEDDLAALVISRSSDSLTQETNYMVLVFCSIIVVIAAGSSFVYVIRVLQQLNQKQRIQHMHKQQRMDVYQPTS